MRPPSSPLRGAWPAVRGLLLLALQVLVVLLQLLLLQLPHALLLCLQLLLQVLFVVRVLQARGGGEGDLSVLLSRPARAHPPQ